MMARPYSIVLDGGDHLVLSLTDEGAVSQLNLRRRILEHDPEKWKPVSRKDHAQTTRKDHDAFPWKRIMI